jgi:hypothetical protein
MGWCRSVVLFVLLFALAGTSRAAAEVPYAKVEIHSSGVSHVCFAPDGRPWFSRSYPKLDVAAFRERVEAAWDGKDPAEIGPGRVDFFEPSGRVWFSFNDPTEQRRLLLSYDGRTWQTFEISERIVGSPQNHVGRHVEATNCWIDGRLFLIGGNHVWIVDGDNIAREQVVFDAEKPGVYDFFPRLRQEPDGLGVVAFSPGEEQPLQRWRDGTWSPLVLPRDERIHRVLADADGYWSLSTSGRLEFVPYATAGAGEPVETIIARLNDEDFGVRDEATLALFDFGPKITPELEAKLSEAGLSDETKARLRYLVARLARSPQESAKPTIELGIYEVVSAHDLFRFGDGTLIIAATRLRDAGRVTMGILRRPPGGEWILHEGKEELRLWTRSASSFPHDQRPLAAGPNHAWLPGDRKTVPATLVTSTLERVRRSPEVSWQSQIVATLADGRAFLKRRRSFEGIVFSLLPEPGLAPIEPTRTLTDRSSVRFDISPEGALYAYHDGVIWRYDRRGFDQYTMMHGTGRVELAAGRAGVILVKRDDNEWFLIQAGGTLDRSKEATPAPDKLIERNLTLFLRSFAESPKVTSDGRLLSRLPASPNEDEEEPTIWRDGNARIELRNVPPNDGIPPTLQLIRDDVEVGEVEVPGFEDAARKRERSTSFVHPLGGTRFFVSTPSYLCTIDFATGERSMPRFLLEDEARQAFIVDGGHLVLAGPERTQSKLMFHSILLYDGAIATVAATPTTRPTQTTRPSTRPGR